MMVGSGQQAWQQGQRAQRAHLHLHADGRGDQTGSRARPACSDILSPARLQAVPPNGHQGFWYLSLWGTFHVQTATTAQLLLSEAQKLRSPHPPACSLVNQNKGIPIAGTGGAGNGECWGHVDRKRMGAADALCVPWQERQPGAPSPQEANPKLRVGLVRVFYSKIGLLTPPVVGFILFCEIMPDSLSEAGLKLVAMLLPQQLKCCIYRHTSP